MNKKKVILGSGIFVVLIVTMTLIWTNFREKPVEGSKAITIEVVDADGDSTKYELNTDAKYLQTAMDEAKEKGLTYAAENGMVMNVNGETASWEKDNAYWCFYVNEKACTVGIAEQVVEDEDEFKIVYTKSE